MKDYDVVIVGAGLAGSCLARQIKLELNDLSVLCLDKSTDISNWKVGEATVEMAADYFGIKLGLQNYLLTHQRLKNGLRFLFDGSDKSLKIENMSENGTTAFPAHCSYTFDRISLERDLVSMNKDLGVDVLLGAQVREIKLNPGEDLHELQYILKDNKDSKTVRCRWLIDSTGRRQLLLKKAGKKITLDKRHKTSSAWGRFEGFADVDRLAKSEKWRMRVNNCSRRSSVLHYMGIGYWIWIIQMPKDIFSIGVVYDNDIISDGPRTQTQLRDFLESHKSLKELMANCKTVDHMYFKNLAYYCEQYFSEDRWGLTGESGAFSDPFYSPGSDFIGIANELLMTLISDDFSGRKDKLAKKVKLYNIYYKDRYERVMRIYQDNYKFFGSYELMKKKYFIDLHNYYNIYYWPFLKNKHRETSWISRSNRRSEVAQKILDVQQAMLTDYYDHLKTTGKYHLKNQGEWHDITAQSYRYNSLVKEDFSEQLSLKYLEETLAIAALSIMSEIHDLPALGALPKYLVNEISLQMLLEWDVKDPKILEPIYSLALKRLQADLNTKFESTQLTQLKSELPGQPLGHLKVEVDGQPISSDHPLSLIANSEWQTLFHPNGNIFC